MAMNATKLIARIKNGTLQLTSWQHYSNSILKNIGLCIIVTLVILLVTTFFTELSSPQKQSGTGISDVRTNPRSHHRKADRSRNRKVIHYSDLTKEEINSRAFWEELGRKNITGPFLSELDQVAIGRGYFNNREGNLRIAAWLIGAAETNMNLAFQMMAKSNEKQHFAFYPELYMHEFVKTLMKNFPAEDIFDKGSIYLDKTPSQQYFIIQMAPTLDIMTIHAQIDLLTAEKSGYNRYNITSILENLLPKISHTPQKFEAIYNLYKHKLDDSDIQSIEDNLTISWLQHDPEDFFLHADQNNSNIGPKFQNWLEKRQYRISEYLAKMPPGKLKSNLYYYRMLGIPHAGKSQKILPLIQTPSTVKKAQIWINFLNAGCLSHPEKPQKVDIENFHLWIRDSYPSITATQQALLYKNTLERDTGNTDKFSTMIDQILELSSQ